jgi:PAS domain S-box-containing protein
MMATTADSELSVHLERQVRAFEITLSSISDFAYIFDRAGRFLYANRPLLDLWGLRLEDVVGKDFFDLKYPDDLAHRLQGQIEQVFQTGQRLSDETPYSSPLGITGYYEYIFSPVFAGDGAVEVVAGVTREITGRKRAENLVDAQRKSLEMLAAGKPLGEILTFLTGIVEEQSGNQSVAAILLLDEEGRLRIGAGASLPDDYNQAIDGLAARADLGTCSSAAVTRQVVITPDIENDPKWACIKHLPLGLGLKAAWSRPIFARDGRVLGTFGTYFRECRRPTERECQVVEILSHTAALAIERHRDDQERERLLTSERAAHAEADAANRAKDKFIAVLSHELRTPLSPVVMAIPMLELDPDLPFKFREDLAMIRRNIELEVKLIDDLLDLSRIASGKLRLELLCVRVHDALRHAINIGASDASGKQILIRQELGAGNDRVAADPARLQQVFWNLVRNAVKFTPEGGQITVRTWNCDAELFVEVHDTGVGIPAELLPRIFDAFEQGDVPTSRQFGGLGLGLAIAKAVVEMHHGTITAASPGPDQGATFTIRLDTVSDRAAVETPDPGASPEVRHPARQTRVLLVEDHHDTAWTLARLLQLSGYHVRKANDAASALQLVDAEQFDVVVSDIGLPDDTGYHLMQQILQRCRIKGIALSGYGMEDDLRKSREAGFADHVIKPVDIRHLQAVIDRVTNGATRQA